MESIELTDKLTAELVQHMGDERTIVNAARVSLDQHSEELGEKDLGLVKFLMKNRHASPFEHCVATFLIECPIFVTREWHRHRTQSYNEMSGRYTELKPVFYAPGYERPLIQVGKPGAYHFEVPQSATPYLELHRDLRFSYQTAWDSYQSLLKRGIAKEVARDILPVAVYTKFYATASLRNWINFLSLRTDPQALYEIRMLAGEVETRLHKIYPNVLNQWDESGRGGL